MTNALAAGMAGIGGGGGGAPFGEALAEAGKLSDTRSGGPRGPGAAPREDRRRSEVAATLEPDDGVVDADLVTFRDFGGRGEADLKDRGGSEEDPNPKSRRLWELGSGRDLGFVEDLFDMGKCRIVDRVGLVGQKKWQLQTFVFRNEIESRKLQKILISM